MRLFPCVLITCLVIAPPAHAELPTKLSATELAAKIDDHISTRWKEHKTTPAPLTEDAEFVRRLHLDVIGRIPDIVTARDFIDNPAKDKREKLIDKLMSSERYAAHWANVWRAWLLPDRAEQFAYIVPTFEMWLRDQLRPNTPYDKIVRELIIGVTHASGSGSSGFQLTYQGQPENAAATVSRLFLGVRLECAQCHNHPFSDWKRQQFWEMAAFFPRQFGTGFSGAGSIVPPPPAVRGEITIPGTDKVVKARFLGAKEDAKWTGDPRTALVDWMVAKDNPFFARALVHRLWEHLLGVGFIDPVDDQGNCNPPSHPVLLDLLAGQFIAHEFDLKYLIKAILLSRSYQLTSRQTHASQADGKLFARRKVRGLSPEQLYDSLALATGQPEELPLLTSYRFNNIANTPRDEFLRRFPSPDKRAEQRISILQALYLMHGKVVADATSLEHNRNLAIIAEAGSVRTSRRIEQLFLITLSRKPTAAESVRLVKYVDAGGPTKQPAQALCDVFWALLNSSEFCANH